MTRPLPAHANALAMDPAAPRLFAGLVTGHVTVLDWERGQGWTIEAPDPPSPLFRLGASADGGALAAVHVAGPTRVWRVPRGGTPVQLAALPPSLDAAWSDRGELFLLGHEGQVLRWSGPDAPDAVELLPARAGLRGLAWGSGRLYLGGQGALLLAAAEPGAAPRRLELEHELAAEYLTVLPGDALLLGCSQRFVALRPGGDRAEGAEEDRFELRRIDHPERVERVGGASPLLAGRGRVRALTAARDGRLAAAAVSGTAHVWDLPRGRELLRLDLRPDAPLLGAELAAAEVTLSGGLDAPVQPVALSAAGDLLACGWPAQRVRVWFLRELGALDSPAEAAARVERLTRFRARGVELEPVDEALDDPRWRRGAR